MRKVRLDFVLLLFVSIAFGYVFGSDLADKHNAEDANKAAKCADAQKQESGG